MIHSTRSLHSLFLSLLFLLSVDSWLAVAQTPAKAPPPPPPPPKKAAPAHPAPAPAQAVHTVPPTPPSGFQQLPRPNAQQTAPNRTAAAQPAHGTPTPANSAQHPSTAPNAARPGSNARSATPSPVSMRQVPPPEAAHNIDKWNAGRSSLPGINSRPLPRNAQLKEASNGRYVMSTADGHNFALSSDGKIRAYLHGNVSAAIDENGRLQAVHGPGMLVKRSSAGERQVESAKSDGTYVVSYGAHRGYVEHPVTVGGRSLVERTTVQNGSVSVSHYQSFSYNGSALENYVPSTSYSPSFYAFLGAPFSAPISYSSPVVAASTSTVYASYYRPEPSYASPSMLMTDQVLNMQLASADVDKSSPAPDESSTPSAFEDLPRVAAPATTPISHEVKTGFAQQLNGVLAGDEQAAQSGNAVPAKEVPSALDPAIQFYFVDDGLDVKTARGDSHCSLSRGVALHRVDPAAPGAKEADVLVVSGLKGDCPSGTHVLVLISDLQAMNNHCHENLGIAVATFSDNAGKNGLPAAPPSGAHPTLPELQQAEVAAKGKEADATIASQQVESLRLESDTNADMLASLH